MEETIQKIYEELQTLTGVNVSMVLILAVMAIIVCAYCLVKLEQIEKQVKVKYNNKLKQEIKNEIIEYYNSTRKGE